MKKKFKIKSEMGIQLLAVGTKIGTALGAICSSTWGKILVFTSFIGVTFAGIAPLIHIILILCVLDLIMGLSVVIHKFGWNHIISSKLRDTLIKMFFYIILLMLLFLIETAMVDGYYLTSKAAFAMISGVEMLSITASLLILFPNFPILKLLKRVLTKEMANKLGLTEEDIKNDTETNN